MIEKVKCDFCNEELINKKKDEDKITLSISFGDHNYNEKLTLCDTCKTQLDIKVSLLEEYVSERKDLRK